MKRVFFVTLVVLVAYGLLTWATYEDNAIVDGFTQIGFPFRFYVQTSGKLADPKYASEFGYFPNYLAYDIIIILVAIIVFNIFAAKIMRKN